MHEKVIKLVKSNYLSLKYWHIFVSYFLKPDLLNNLKCVDLAIEANFKMIAILFCNRVSKSFIFPEYAMKKLNFRKFPENFNIADRSLFCVQCNMLFH